mmetsp:Transcript_35578/g.87508  ORF Transcript_35578/g.87508 Transcript_35578/m.87508 type:complete len:328 (+) Transcript_35578:848-1831(+)
MLLSTVTCAAPALGWSLDVGPAHVVGLSSYAPVSGRGLFDGSDAPMAAWLRRDLKAVDRALTPWVVVMFHAPWYNSNAGHFKEAWRAQEALEQDLYDAGVDVVLNGHVHSYERSHPVHKWGVDPCGPVHLVVGDGGNYEGPYGGSWREPQPEWSAFREGSFGAGKLSIHNATHASWEWRRTTCVAPAGETSLNWTFYAPDGKDGANCSSHPDVSAQAMEAVDQAVFVRDVGRCPNRAVGSGSGSKPPTPTPAPAPAPAPASEDGKAAKTREAAAVAMGVTIAFLSVGWAGTLAALVRVVVLLRRERGQGAASRQHVLIHDDDEMMSI